MFPPLGAQTPASRILRVNSGGTEVGFNRRIDRVVRMTWKRSAVIGACSAIIAPSIGVSPTGTPASGASLAELNPTPPVAALRQPGVAGRSRLGGLHPRTEARSLAMTRSQGRRAAGV